ncbi:MAG TPA: FixH family protein [Candidatus Competibacter sp.]|jgi:nitrogen fixation protein FixH|nr:FixH family protein [Candidatus Competibacter sp.]HRX62235.1 FixH family protein [Candidatus Competibacter sp.]HUM91954.1 FixH family protein [Candidatus Competibacter sp.]
MTEWLFGLAVGAGLILLANLALIRFMGVSAKYAAAVVALVTIGLYGPYSIVRWPGGDVFAIHLGIYLLVSLACGMLLGARSQGEGMHWGPAVIGGFFIFVVVSGAVFVTVAERGLTPSLRDWLLPAAHSGREVSSLFPGVISHDFQQKEELYNQYLQQVERQRQRGWQVQKGWLSDPMINEPAVFRVVVRTREGEPMTGATVVGQFLRPSNSKQDIAFTLAETDPGVYESKLLLPLAGHWNLVLEIRKGDDLHEIRAVTQVSDR